MNFKNVLGKSAGVIAGQRARLAALTPNQFRVTLAQYVIAKVRSGAWVPAFGTYGAYGETDCPRRMCAKGSLIRAYMELYGDLKADLKPTPRLRAIEYDFEGWNLPRDPARYWVRVFNDGLGDGAKARMLSIMQRVVDTKGA